MLDMINKLFQGDLEKTSHADVAELADALDLGSSAFGRAGSIPVIRIRCRLSSAGRALH